VGTYWDASNVAHGFLLNGGQYTNVDDPSGTNDAAFGINDSGQIVGGYNVYFVQGYYGQGVGCLRNPGGQYFDVNYPSAATDADCGINNAGKIVGDYAVVSYNVPFFVFHSYLATWLFSPASNTSARNVENDSPSATSAQPGPQLAAGGLTPNVFGSVLAVFPPPRSVNAGAMVLKPLGIPPLPGTLVPASSVGSIQLQAGHTSSVVPQLVRATGSQAAIDQLFANFQAPLVSALCDDSAMV
jgi:hypothetical protein